jgi:hypothetical protein
MELDKEAREFNEKQKRLHEYYETEGRHLSRVEDELKKVNNSLGFLIDTLLKYLEDEEKRRKEDYRRSTYGMHDPVHYRTQRGSDESRWSGMARPSVDPPPYRNPFKHNMRDTPPYDLDDHAS